MFEEYQICPYTGLRSFTEEESLYFKGREEHINLATEQLQRNRFLMLTGASGDGKSSLVYAGIIPNARAGFLKSRYTNWCVADFRPERTPFQNLCKSLARQLDIPNISTVEAELQHGFSALVDLYRNSKRFIDNDSVQWQGSDDAGKSALKREAANLIILVDQFEEFFTNPENYHNGVPSRDSGLVLNILLETARIALEENLPIYIVLTMRSDYIGQCAAFRGLPEYIGFSQFFVPRLNRAQLQQVIEEPATLSGNRITRRLTERLIHDITDGVDQLPILQHALNQIWVAANNGNEEMDLIHYAMVGGMSVEELPEGQVARFKIWFDAQTPAIQTFYREPNLQNVLDTHTNKLFEQAAEYYFAKTGNTISESDAKAIIKNAFTCLTKIDQNRAVRNRMTLLEMTNIFGRPEFDAAKIGAVLNIFREPGNTFIRPFINDDTETQTLLPNQVLDITHESLIRNWEYLEKWAQEEFESYSVSIDFGKQLNRWVKSGKSNAHLFSIGPLTYFETWFNTAKPNAWWIARYLPEEIQQEKKLNKAKRILSNAGEFLHRSGRAHVVTRTIMKYGPKRIAAVLGIVAVLTLSSFAFKNYLQRQNSYVLTTIHDQTLSIAGNAKATFLNKLQLIAEELKMGRVTVPEVVNAIADPIQKINVADGIATQLIFQGITEPKKEIFSALALADSMLDHTAIPQQNVKLSAVLKEINDLRVTLELGFFYNPDAQLDQWRVKNAKRSGLYVKHIITQQPKDFSDVVNLTMALENAINHKTFSGQEIDDLLKILSPFENAKRSEWLTKNFNRDQVLIRGTLNYGLTFNGLYQELAYLYAAKGNSDRSLQCMDTLLRYSQSNFQGNYEEGIDNASNIAAVFYRYHQIEPLNHFVAGYCERKKVSQEHFYNKLLASTWHSLTTASNLNLAWWTDVNSNLNLQFGSREQLSFFYHQYRQVVEATVSDADQNNFLLALSFKDEGIAKSLNNEKPTSTELSTRGLFDKSMEHFKRVGKKYLEEPIPIMSVGTDAQNLPRKYLMVYPDFKSDISPVEARSFFFNYTTDVFIEYILDNKLFDSFYPTVDEQQYFSTWLANYNSIHWATRAFMVGNARTETLTRLEREFEKRQIHNVDLNLLYLNLGWTAQQEHRQDDMLYYYRHIDGDNIFNILRSKEFVDNSNGHTLQLIALAVMGFARSGHMDEAYKIVSLFKQTSNRSSLYAHAAAELALEKFDRNVVRQLIDSSRSEAERVKDWKAGQPNKPLIAYALTLENPNKNVPEAYKLIKNVNRKFTAIQNICKAYAFHEELFEAIEHIPADISDTDQATFMWNILMGYERNLDKGAPEWKAYDAGFPYPLVYSILYVDENN